MIYTLDQSKERIPPVAQKYKLRAVYQFGSYAGNEATEVSDLDILIDRNVSIMRRMFDIGGIYNDLFESIGKEIDLVTSQTLEQQSTQRRTPWLVDYLRREMLKLY